MNDHKHVFKATMHMDGCHFYEWQYVCSCGVALALHQERDFRGDPYSFVWSENGGCDRCLELEQGARRKPYLMMLAEPGKPVRRIWQPELTRITS